MKERNIKTEKTLQHPVAPPHNARESAPPVPPSVLLLQPPPSP